MKWKLNTIYTNIMALALFHKTLEVIPFASMVYGSTDCKIFIYAFVVESK